MAMRDLFQAVYELKKREVELAKQNIEQHQLKYGSSFFLDSISASSSKVRIQFIIIIYFFFFMDWTKLVYFRSATFVLFLFFHITLM